MSKAVGFVLILAGIGVASSLLPIGADPATSSAGAAAARPAEPVRIAVMAHAKALPESAAPPAVAKRQAVAPTVRPAAAEPPVPSPIPVVVTLTHRVEPGAPTAPPKARRTPTDRASLARDLQFELRRVGCYGGDLNGVWTPATRKAMKAFTEQVNATLPVESPDNILLSLVQAHQGEACGRPCPAGQGLADDGRCLPNALLAQSAKKATPPPVAAAPRRGGEADEKPAPAITGWTTMTTAAAPPRPEVLPPFGRMALAGPKTDAPPVAAEQPPGPREATRERNKRTGAARRAAAGRVHDRRRERVAVRTYATRSNFVESILRDRRSVN